MRADLILLKNIYLSTFEKQPSKFVLEKSETGNTLFWNSLNNVLIDNDCSKEKLISLFNELNIEVDDSFLSKLKLIKEEYFAFLSCSLMLQEKNHSIDVLLNNNNEDFLREIQIDNEIKKSFGRLERNKIKELFNAIDKDSNFEMPDIEISLAFERIDKKWTQQELKGKMLEWDNDSGVQNFLPKIESKFTEENNTKPKKIILYYIQYAVAASIIGLLISVGTYLATKQQYEIKMVTKYNNQNIKSHPKQNLADIDIIEKKIAVIGESGSGFANINNNKMIEIKVYNTLPRIVSIQKYLNENKNDTTNLSNKYNYELELMSLQNLEHSYMFDGQILQLFVPVDTIEHNCEVIFDHSNFYLKLKNIFYKLSKSEKPMELVKVSNNVEIERLEKIAFIF